MTKLKILFLFPNTSNEGVAPLAIGILSAIARAAGYRADYFETSFYKKRSSAGEDRERTGEFKPFDRKKKIHLRSYDRLFSDFKKKLKDYKPDIMAVSANSLEYELFCDLVKDINLSASGTFVIVGGVHATIAPDEVIRNPRVDAICLGEGEEAWREFLTKFKLRKDISRIKNIWFKDGNNIQKNPIRPLLREDKLWQAPADLSFFNRRHFLKPFDGKLYFRCQSELSRGCPYNCSYCVNSTFKSIYRGLGKYVRIRSLDSFKAEVKRLVSLGCNMLQLQDECFFTMSYETLKKFCSWYARKVRLPLLIQTRPEFVTEEKVKLLADMKVPIQISCGVESGSRRILRSVCSRSATIDQIRSAYRIIKKYGLRSNAYTMIGFPTETRGEVFKTINLIREIKPDVSIMSVFFPFKGVPLREKCLEKGYISGNERTRTFTESSILKKQPMSSDEINNLRRSYRLYTTLPKEYFPEIELCERSNLKQKALYRRLVSLSWRLRE